MAIGYDNGKAASVKKTHAVPPLFKKPPLPVPKGPRRDLCWNWVVRLPCGEVNDLIVWLRWSAHNGSVAGDGHASIECVRYAENAWVGVISAGGSGCAQKRGDLGLVSFEPFRTWF